MCRARQDQPIVFRICRSSEGASPGKIGSLVEVAAVSSKFIRTLIKQFGLVDILSIRSVVWFRSAVWFSQAYLFQISDSNSDFCAGLVDTAQDVQVHLTRRAPHATDLWSLPVPNQALRRLSRVSAETSAISTTKSKRVLRLVSGRYACCCTEKK